jgi:hypothetical protein
MTAASSDKPANMLPSMESLAHDPGEEWSQQEVWWIQLDSELNFALAALPSAPWVLTADLVAYENFREYFSKVTPIVSEISKLVKTHPKHTLKDFGAKRAMLVPGLLRRVSRIMVLRSKHVARNLTWGFVLTPTILEEYGNLREELGLETDILHPERVPQLWKFLGEKVAEQYPHLVAATPQEDIDDMQTSVDHPVPMAPLLPVQSIQLIPHMCLHAG